MKTFEMRLEQETNEILKSFLQAGKLPASTEVTLQLENRRKERGFDKPWLGYKTLGKKFRVANLEEFQLQTCKDLDLLYTAVGQMVTDTAKEIRKIESEKEQLSYMLNQLGTELEACLAQTTESGYLNGYVEAFHDLGMTDLTKTTAAIDLGSQTCSLPKYAKQAQDGYTITVRSDSEFLQNGDPADYFGQPGKVWGAVVTKASQEKTFLILDLDLGEVKKINELRGILPMIKRTGVKIYQSEDKVVWIQTWAGEVVYSLSVDSMSQARYLQIVLEKSEADKYNEKGYEYHFLVDTLTLATTETKAEATYRSAPIRIPTGFDTLSLMADVTVPPLCSVQWYLSTDTVNPSWVPVSPVNQKAGGASKIFLSSSTKYSQQVYAQGADKTVDACEIKSMAVNGQRIFQIAAVEGVLARSRRLYKGANCWRIDSLPLSISLEEAQNGTTFSERSSEITTSYLPMPVNKNGLLLNAVSFSAPKLLRYSIYFQREEDSEVVLAPLVSNRPVTVAVNGSQIYSGEPNRSVVRYPFLPGMNVIEVIIPVDETCSLDLNLDLSKTGNTIRGNLLEMKEVSVFDLRFNTNNRKDVYAIQASSAGNQILVKDEDVHIPYLFQHTTISEIEREVIVRADLLRKTTSATITPVIHQYELRWT